MKIHVFLAALAIAAIFPLHADELHSLEKDYYSLQIASGLDPQPMEKLFQRYSDLPFVRIEKRGTLYVLRAGFWADQAAARLAISKFSVNASFLRVAAFRPDAIVQKNWQGDGQASVPPAPALIARSPTERSGNSTLISFNQEDYLLAYEVFVGSGDLEQAYRVAEKAARQVPQDSGWQKRLATVAAWTQRQDVAAEYYFLARQQTSDRDEARRLFLAGMDALMAGSRFKQAMEAADRYLGDLANDRATLRHLAPIALAAGEPARAASYIDKLVFRPKGTQGKP